RRQRLGGWRGVRVGVVACPGVEAGCVRSRIRDVRRVRDVRVVDRVPVLVNDDHAELRPGVLLGAAQEDVDRSAYAEKRVGGGVRVARREGLVDRAPVLAETLVVLRAPELVARLDR